MLAGAHTQGMAAQTGIGSTTVLTAAGSGNRYHVDRVIICVSVHQDTGTISMTDGTTVFIPYFLAKDDNGSVFTFDFGPYGYVCEDNAAVTLTVSTAAVACAATVLARKVSS